MDHAQKMREVLAAAGAGTQGDYTGTSFTSIDTVDLLRKLVHNQRLGK